MSSDLQRELQEAVGNVYAIERELARGGMSRVFLAVERSLGRRVVINDAAAWSNAAHRAARVFVRIGEYDAAIDLIEQLLRAPSWVSVPTLRTDPVWAPLREHPRFQRLVGRG